LLFGALFKVHLTGILNQKLEVAVADLIKGWNEQGIVRNS